MKKSGITGVTLLAALLLAGCANKNEGTSFSKQYDEAAKNRLKRYKLSIDGSTYTPGRGDNTEESVQIWVSAKKRRPYQARRQRIKRSIVQGNSFRFNL